MILGNNIINQHGFLVSKEFLSKGDPIQLKLAYLYERLNSTEKNLSDFEVRKQILIVAKATMGHPISALMNRRYGSPQCTVQRDFVDDTINFIRTGKRSINICNWRAMLDDETLGDQHHFNEGLFKPDTRLNVSDFTGNTPADVIHRWVQHPGGYADMLITMYLLFGHLSKHQ